MTTTVMMMIPRREGGRGKTDEDREMESAGKGLSLGQLAEREGDGGEDETEWRNEGHGQQVGQVGGEGTGGRAVLPTRAGDGSNQHQHHHHHHHRRRRRSQRQENPSEGFTLKLSLFRFKLPSLPFAYSPSPPSLPPSRFRSVLIKFDLNCCLSVYTHRHTHTLSKQPHGAQLHDYARFEGATESISIRLGVFPFLHPLPPSLPVSLCPTPPHTIPFVVVVVVFFFLFLSSNKSVK